MNPLLIVLIAFLIGFIEWFLAVRRQIAVEHREKANTFILVLVEGILAWLVLSSFLNVSTCQVNPELNFFIGWLTAYKWKIATAFSACLGGALGSLAVVSRKPIYKKPQ